MSDENQYDFNIATHNGAITMTNPATGEHRTVQVRTQKDDANFAPGQRIIEVLAGGSRYEGFGFVVNHNGQPVVRLWTKKRTRYYRGLASMVENPAHWAQRHGVIYQFEGRCRRCNATLTNPESISTGIGPVCGRREGEARAPQDRQRALPEVTAPIRLFSYRKPQKSLVAEISTLGWDQVPRAFQLQGEKETRTFSFTHKDTDASGEDTAGWHYRSGDFTALIIND